MIAFNRTYFICFLILFGMEYSIACYIKDAFIRPYFGDFLAIISLYVLIKSFITIPPLYAVAISFMVSTVLEILQFIHFLKFINMEKNKTLKTLLGTSFSWVDMAAYALGALVILYVESKTRPRKA